MYAEAAPTLCYTFAKCHDISSVRYKHKRHNTGPETKGDLPQVGGIIFGFVIFALQF